MKEENKCSCSSKSTYRSDKEKKDLTKRLNIIEGQIRGINQMVADDRYCDDILIQIAAEEKSLKSLGNFMLENHLKNCVVSEIQKGDLEIIEEVMTLIKKLQ